MCSGSLQSKLQKKTGRGRGYARKSDCSEPSYAAILLHCAPPERHPRIPIAPHKPGAAIRHWLSAVEDGVELSNTLCNYWFEEIAAPPATGIQVSPQTIAHY